MRLAKIFRHLANPKSLPSLIWRNLAYPFSPEAADKRYDRQFGIDTTGYIEPAELGFAAQAWERAQPYGPTPPAIAEFLIRKVASKAAGFTFMDIGSGKGRVLMIAAGFPFRRVVGIEHAAGLNAVAAENIRHYSKHRSGLAPIELITGDATQIPLPKDPLVVYLFSPLGPKAMEDFAAALKTSYLQSPRKIICVYYNTEHHGPLDQTGIFPIRENVDYPADPCDRYRDHGYGALIYETQDE